MPYNQYFSEVKEPHKQQYKTGVLLVNLGTPADLSYKTLRKYYWQFLSDPRVVEKCPAFWKTLLQCVLLQIIPFKGQKNYKKVWDKEKNESPLLTHTRNQAEKVQNLYGDDLVVDFAMRYGAPSIEEKMKKMKAQGVQKLVIFPLYPQYAGATTASVYDAVFDCMKKFRWMPELKMIMNYQDHPAYISALKKTIEDAYNTAETKPETLVCSYHGIPKRYWKNGDPYPCHCFHTTKLLKESLGWGDEQIISTFQSRFGKEEWVQPYSDKHVENLAENGVKNIAVISPAFASDCIETLEELDMEMREDFLAAGGTNFVRIPCLNDSDAHIDMMKQIIDEKLK